LRSGAHQAGRRAGKLHHLRHLGSERVPDAGRGRPDRHEIRFDAVPGELRQQRHRALFARRVDGPVGRGHELHQSGDQLRHRQRQDPRPDRRLRRQRHAESRQLRDPAADGGGAADADGRPGHVPDERPVEQQQRQCGPDAGGRRAGPARDRHDCRRARVRGPGRPALHEHGAGRDDGTGSAGR